MHFNCTGGEQGEMEPEIPLTLMRLRCCNSFFGEGALEPWDYFVHLGELVIYRYDVLVHWPEKAF